MDGRRIGEVRKRISEVLNAADERNRLSTIPGLSLAKALHTRIGGANFISFDNMFRELHYLTLSGELTSRVLDLAMQIYTSADHLDIKEYRNRRRIELGAT